MGESIEREELPLDVVIVGAGPAGLACAYHLSRLIERESEAHPELAETAIAVLEKGAHVGAHILSGAILDPVALSELMPDFAERGAPFEGRVSREENYFLTPRGSAWPLPYTPGPMRNEGLHITRLGKFVKWLAEQVESAGVDILTGFPGQELLYEGGRVTGVRTGDKGVGADGKPKGNFEPGADVTARVVVLSEGVRGSLSKQLIARQNLDAGCAPQVYSTGVKEVWEIPAGRVDDGTIYGTVGYPLGMNNYGGGFVYKLAGNEIALGLVTGLGYADPQIDPHGMFQTWKTHPFIQGLIEGGKPVAYGAKAIPDGGYHSLPRLHTDGALLTGDGAGFLNVMRLKGVHTAMKSGMLAAETILESLKSDDFSAVGLSGMDRRYRNSWLHKELRQARNFHSALSGGLLFGMPRVGLQSFLGGWDPFARRNTHTDAESFRKLADGESHPALAETQNAFASDEDATRTKLDDVYLSGTTHEEDQPCHLKVADTNICIDQCTKEFGNPCQYFCPANVYEMVESDNGDGRALQINFSNCVHCKTCDIKDPYQIITWVPPQGEDGPVYQDL